MINFRFHIVSLTAVLLALGIGLVLGTTFLDDATIDQLDRQLDGLETDLVRARARNDEQQSRLDRFQDEAARFDEEAGARVYDGFLAGVPVLVVSTDGVDERWVDGVLRLLGQADADVVGVWWLTERLALDDDDEVGDLSDALGLDIDAPDRLVHNLSVDLSNVLFGAVDAEGDVPPEEAAAGEPEQAAPTEPALLARLRASGFVSYELPEGAEGDLVRLPASGLRVVVVDGPGASLAAGHLLVPVLDELTNERAAPVVATQPTLATGDEADDAAQPELVGAIRGEEALKGRVSTVDNLDWPSGRVSTLLATVDAVPGEPVIGHYGTGDGADVLFPPAAESG